MDVRRRTQIGGIKKTSSGGDDVIPEPIINTDNYLTIEALENGLTASLSTNACEYCVDGDGNWKSLDAGAATQSINSGHTLSFRGNLTPASNKGIGTFTISKKCNLNGNCMSMLFKDNAADNYSLSGKNYAFYKLFYNCKNIVNVSSNFLPATTIAIYCYRNMFSGCTKLTAAPELPATTLADNCYYHMFNGCTSLTTAPELPATTLSGWCYDNMFRSCTKLNYIKMLATDISAYNCLTNWVSGVASTGTFVKNPNMTTLPVGANGIPSGWTVVNDGEESGGNLITFTVDGTEYQAEEGMTWGEWCNSEYNVISAFIGAGGYVKCRNLEILTSTYNSVNSNKLILHGESYRIGSHSGSND